MAKSDLTCEQLRAAFHYDQDTGIFTRIQCADRSHIGDTLCGLDAWGYIRFRVFGRKYRAHRLAWFYCFGEWPREQIDHIDNNKLNNSLGNLRDVSQDLNQQNNKKARCDSITGARGVSPSPLGFKVQVTHGKKKINGGTYATIEEASAAYWELKKRHHPGLVLG